MRRAMRVENSGSRVTVLLFCFAILALMMGAPAYAQITVSVTGPGGSAQQELPNSGGSFDMNIPLNKNAVNTITVTAKDSSGNSASQELKVTQLALEEIVVSKITATRLSVQEVEQLVNEGIINLADPANYNVSTFDIVLTIAGNPVPVKVPIAVPKAEESGWEVYKLPQGSNSNSGTPNPPPPEIIVFDETVAGPPGEPPISIPGVLVIEGKIKSLKEFYSVRLLLMNTSGIFTLTDITAKIVFPEGGLSAISPKDGIISFGEILPGEGNTPGQKEKEYIIRGDEIGIRDVRVDFGGLIRGPGIAEDAPIAFNGSALTEVEVKGPPTFKVEVSHPDSVVKDVPYELKVEITNTSDIAAMYASLSLALGADGVLVKCSVDDNGEPVCTDIEGDDSRYLGHILPGQKVSQVFTVRPLKTGFISSCMGASDQNISLQVYVGNIGCIVGQFPPGKASADGSPSVSILPIPNSTGLSTDTPVTAFFSELMKESSITTGPGGSFNVFNSAGSEVWGQLRFIELNEKTVAIWQPTSGTLVANKKYTVVLSTSVTDLDGSPLTSKWESTFTTTGTGLNDVDPPTISMSIDPSVSPSYVLPGQIVKVDVYTADQGTGVSRVEARLKDLSDPDASYALIDQKTVFSGDNPPFIFPIDSANLTLDHAYQFRATAYDGAGNVRESTIAFKMAPTASAPGIVLPDDPAAPILHGISVDLTPQTVTGGVREVRYYLDGATNPFRAISVAPYHTTLGTLGLTLGSHTVRAVALDPLGNHGEDSLTFTLAENRNMPSVNFGSSVDGAQYVKGESILVKPIITDPVGLASVSYYLDSLTGELLYSGFAPIMFDTTGRDFGSHTIYVKATNNLGISNDTNDPNSSLQFKIVPFKDLHPPEVSISNVTYPENGQVTVTGQVTRIIDDQPAGAAGGAKADITNTSLGIMVTVYASAGGVFSAAVPGQAGQHVSVIAYDYDQSQNPSPEKTAVIAAAPVLTGISVNPSSWVFSARNAYIDIAVTGTYDQELPSADITSQATFSSSNPAVASVNSAGRVVALSYGSAIITAAVSGFQAQVTINCTIIDLLNISVQPATVDLPAIGQTQALTVTGHYSDGSQKPLTDGVSYLTGDPGIATVNASGIITATGNGSTQISVSKAGVPAVAVPVTVNTEADPAPIVQILSPLNGSNAERDQAITVSVRATDALGGVKRIFLDVAGETVYSEIKQISPASPDTTQVFTVIISGSAAIGGNITVNARAEDTSGHLSQTASSLLKVVDATAPAVTITQPANHTRFNYGDTVALSVSATDAVGVTQIRYEMTGALAGSKSQTISPAAQATTAQFSFVVPSNLASPDAQIVAYAKDAAGNERASIPVNIFITSADITPSATHVTSVNVNGATAVVTFQVDSGAEDVNYVELYFRRNGIGEFARYTDAAGNNPEGRYAPQPNGSGTIVFNSAKMGGDGTYEFYSVGVDFAGNREKEPRILRSPTQYSGLLAYYPFNGDAMDASGSGNNGSIVGAQLTTDKFDISNRALSFDGSSDYVTLGSSVPASLQIQDEITLAAWIYVTGYPASNTLGTIVGCQYDSNTSGYAIHLDGRTNPDSQPSPAGHIHFQIGNGSWHTTNVNAQVPLNKWVFVAATRKKNEAANVYYNGALQPSTSVPWDGAITYNGSELDIGRQSGISNRYFNGVIDEVQIFDRALTAAEISELSYAVTPDATAIFSAGTVWTEITTETTVGASDTTLDDRNIRVKGKTFTVNGTHSFRNIELLNGAVLTHSETDATVAYNLNISAWTITVDASSSINVDGRGYIGGSKAGNNQTTGRTVGNTNGASYRSGGSYGGFGGVYDVGPTNPLYGELKDPADLGSGGSTGCNGNYPGGDGGGRIVIQAINLIANGSITANGEGGHGCQAGSGSGGTVNIRTSTISGAATITANGGASEVGGGGGRIAIRYTDNSTMNASGIQALGGQGANVHGGNGTIYFLGSTQTAGDLVIDGNNASTPAASTEIPKGNTFDNITLKNQARAYADGPIVVNNALQVLTNSILTNTAGLETGLSIKAAYVFVDTTSSIDASAKGYAGGVTSGYNNGLTLGGLQGAAYRSGGSYGGYGGVFDGTGTNIPYGHPSNPVYLGSGGSIGCNGNYRGGRGGGFIHIAASESVTVDGSILANGEGGYGCEAGSGSGGSIKIETSVLNGAGSIAANGGVSEVGGGGGRIAIAYDYLGESGDDLNDLRNVTAFGGHGSNVWGSAGTVLLRRSNQAYGDLYIDDNMSSATAPNYTPLTLVGFGPIAELTGDTITIGNGVALGPNGLAGLEINPNLSQTVTYTVKSNTDTTITFDTTGKPALTSIAAKGDEYAAIYRFDNVYFRRGGYMVTGDRLIVGGTIKIDEYGKLTHFDATTKFEPMLDIRTESLEVTSTGSINVDARGYLGGVHNGNGDHGLQIGNVSGAAYRSAGSYGGLGAVYDGGPTNPIYGSLTDPVGLGSGGSIGCNGSYRGGDGGGWVAIYATNIVLNGTITANGEGGFGCLAGSGSGGSVNIRTNTLSGTGTIKANGGASEVGGGGGRIAIRYSDRSAMDASGIQALGGHGGNAWGGNGTIYFLSSTQTNGDLLIDGNNVSTPSASTEIPNGYVFDNITIKNQARVLADHPLQATGAFQILTGSILTHSPGLESGLSIQALQLTVDATSSIDVSAKGYAGGVVSGYGYGLTTGGAPGSVARSGGSYGGRGAVYDGGPSNPIYGSLTDPVGLGSGGSIGCSNSYRGGRGGGWVALKATAILLNGSILANGEAGVGCQAGSGSGGTVNIRTSTLSGTGTIAANGGLNEVGGGGGRIAVRYSDLSAMNTAGIQALGGHGGNVSGGNGTIFFLNSTQTNGDLVIDGNNVSTPSASTEIPKGYVFDTIVIKNNARVLADNSIAATEAFQLLTGSVLTHTAGLESGLSIEAPKVTVDATSSIDVSAKGYPGGTTSGSDYGMTLGGIHGATYRSGGSYGGYGGVYDGTGTNQPYGHPAEPAYLGSGGSIGCSSGWRGGRGGGLVHITASDSVAIEGSILANGEAGAGCQAGSGSGGSIKIDTRAFSGSGTIAANGGVNEVGGGGGRIAVFYDSLGGSGEDLNGLRNITAFGGHGGNVWGSAGTVLLRRSGQSYGDLYVDDNMTNATASNYTPLTLVGFGSIAAITADSITTDGGVTMVPNGLVGLEINPNLNQSVTYRVKSNDTTTITLDTAGKPILTAIATVGDAYSAINRFDNIYFRRGGYMVLGDRLIVGGMIKIDEYGKLTHYDATTNFEPMLDVTASSLEVSSTSSINVDARGYLGGSHNGNGVTGRTAGNVSGAVARSGGSYGGLGGVYDGGPTNPLYGSSTNPMDLGSGGSVGCGSGWRGGDGGGWVAIDAANLVLNGPISAKGENGYGCQAGSGSGGTINILAATISGVGTITADGGAGEVGGGGGRIAIRTNNLSGLNSITVTTTGGHGGNRWGADGTIYTHKN
jgi:hypothetical protein